MKNIQILILKNEQILISEVTSVTQEIGEPDCKLIKPKLVIEGKTPKERIIEWLNFTKQDVIADIEEIRTKEKKPKIVGYQLTHPYAITLSRIENDESKLSVNISRWNPYSADAVYQIPADIVNVICEPLPKLKESWEEKVKAEEEAIAAVTNEVKPTNTVIEQELLNEEHTDTDTKE